MSSTIDCLMKLSERGESVVTAESKAMELGGFDFVDVALSCHACNS